MSGQWEPSVWSCVAYVWKVGAALIAAAGLLLWWAANHPGGLLDRAMSALLPGWMGEDR